MLEVRMGGDKMIMVDELVRWPHAKRRCFKMGSCHLTTYGDIESLHEFAKRIGMKREWFQDHPLAPHYDLSPARREAALSAGAFFVSARDQAIERVARRKQK